MPRFLLAALFLLLLPRHPAAAAPEAIVDTAGLEAAIARGAVVWDVRGRGAYRKGHIPGAVNVGNAGQVLRNPNSEDYLPRAKIEAILGGAGIDPAREIVVYSTRGNPGAYFALYTLRYFGADQVRVYHEGIDGWREAGKPVSTEPAKRAAVALRLAPRAALVASTEEVIAAARRGDVQLLDVRRADEFSGDDVRAIRGGHIPGAVNIPYEQNWVDPDVGRKLREGTVRSNAGAALKPMAELKSLYSGLDPNKETIVYCQSGVRAAETATVLSALGFANVKVYDSSWLGYAARLDAPAKNEVFVNVGALRGQVSALHERIDQLEALLVELLQRQQQQR